MNFFLNIKCQTNGAKLHVYEIIQVMIFLPKAGILEIYNFHIVNSVCIVPFFLYNSLIQYEIIGQLIINIVKTMMMYAKNTVFVK